MSSETQSEDGSRPGRRHRSVRIVGGRDQSGTGGGDAVNLSNGRQNIAHLQSVTNEVKRAHQSPGPADDLLIQVQESLHDPIVALDPGFRILTFNASFARTMRRLFGTSIAVGDNFAYTLSAFPDVLLGALADFRRALSGEVFSAIRDFPVLDGRRTIFDLRCGPIWDDAGDVVGLSIILRDETDHVRSEIELRESEARFRSLVQGCRQGILVHRDFMPLFANDAYARILGCSALPEIGEPPSLLPFIVEERRAELRRSHADLLQGERGFFEGRLEVLRKDGVPIWVDLRSETVGWDASPAVQTTIIDVTDHVHCLRRLEEERADYRAQAITDVLTGVHSRRHSTELAQQELTRSNRYGRPLSLMIVDIDDFKEINLTGGHAAGDEALRQLAQTSREVLRDADILGRMGGDEFTVVLPETGIEEATAVAERLREALRALDVSFGDRSFGLTVSIGVGEFHGADRLDDLLLRADRALFQAKAQGRDRVVKAAT